MVRQCAWCLRLINGVGERVSLQPLPKLYEASHGICGICGIQWMEQVIEAEGPLGTLRRQEIEASAHESVYAEVERHESITQMVLQLQEQTPDIKASPRPRRFAKLPIR
ncbi:hypothetical protein [Dictyobacter arantiisoli]|uniref:Uncharacterized protein n=1 Tax=Dictyobacter arantiisoli TaxID=2014874 RepID=A0A5A5T864_9CHLR|nr:hypothetical protein [Dictyobacter arantiisoli]GCF07223.1 hypothetical protein KDI_07870 [Dictyobacter arantiisoli]